MGSNEPTLGELLDRAEDGDAEAIAALERFGADIDADRRKLAAASRTHAAELAERIRPVTVDFEALAADIAEQKREAIQREEAKIAELGATRKAVQAAERRERVRVRVTIAACVFGGVSAVAAVVAIFA